MTKKRKGILALCAVLVVILSGMLVACSNQTDNLTATKLYQYKNTFVGDNSKVVAITALLPLTDLTRDKVELHTDNEPYGITINYVTKEAVREVQDNDFLILERNAAIMLSLIHNANYVEFLVNDTNGESRYGTKITREISKDYFLSTFDFNGVTDTENNFTEFYNKVMTFTFANYIHDKVIEVIPKDRQIQVNSGQSFSFTFKNNIKTQNFDLASIAKEYGVNINDYYGNKIDVNLYEIETSNLSSQQYTSSPYIFVFCAEKLLGYKDLKSIEVEQEIKPYLIQLTEESNGYKGTIIKYTQNYFSKAYEKYYEILGFVTVDNYAYEIKNGTVTATFPFKMKYKNFYQDPDTVGYIKEAKEKGSKEYQTLYDEYNQEQESNFSLKATANLSKDGIINDTTIRIFDDVSVKDEKKYVPIEDIFPK